MTASPACPRFPTQPQAHLVLAGTGRRVTRRPLPTRSQPPARDSAPARPGWCVTRPPSRSLPLWPCAGAPALLLPGTLQAPAVIELHSPTPLRQVPPVAPPASLGVRPLRTRRRRMGLKPAPAPHAPPSPCAPLFCIVHPTSVRWDSAPERLAPYYPATGQRLLRPRCGSLNRRAVAPS